MSTTFSVSRDSIISAALRKLGVLELGATPDTDTVTNSAQILNIMIKAWQSSGIKLWTINEYTLPLVASKTLYTIGPASDLVTDKPLKVIQAWMRNISSDIDTPVSILSQQEYNLLGSKTSLGMVNSLRYDSMATSGNMYLWNTPDTYTASTYQLHFSAQRPMTDISISSDIPDFPTEWMQALVWGLADELAIEYGVPGNHRQEITAKALKYRSDLEDWDTEDTPTFFTPDSRSR